jgi:hypothetical protein
MRAPIATPIAISVITPTTKSTGFEILIVIWRRPYGWAKFLSPLCADPLFDDASA